MLKIALLCVCVVGWLEPLEANPHLVQLNVMFRHGARTPLAQSFPTDPYVDYLYPPYGRGQLTKAGKRGAYELGTQLRYRYDRFLGKHYNNSNFNFYSDSSVRVQETGLIAMAAIWIPTHGEQFEYNLPWQPVSYQLRTYYPADDGSEDYKYLSVLSDQEFIKDRLEAYKDNITYIYQEAGITSLIQLSYVWATLAPQVDLKLPIPKWAHEIFPSPLSEINYQIFASAVYPKALRQQGGCRDLEAIIENMDTYIETRNIAKSIFYAAHDNNLVTNLECLTITSETLSPDFVANMALELGEEDGNYYVRVVYQRSLSLRAKPLTIPGCTEWCPYDDFRDLVYKNIE